VSQSGGEISFEINKFSRVKNHENVEAFCSVIFDGVLEVFCRIIKGKNGLWIAWPAHKVDGKWVKDFDFVDLNFKERVEGTLMERLTASG
jgi:DNA-binding cell septation regulator SpoVG